MMLKRFLVLAFLRGITSISSLQANDHFFQNERFDSGSSTDRCWADADYLYWKIKDSPESVPLLIEQSLPASDVVFGGNLKNGWRSGGKFGLGYWFDDSSLLGGEVSYFFLAEGTKSQTIHSNGSQLLSVPFFNVLTGIKEFSNVALPGVFSGNAKLKLSNFMQGSELNMVANIPYHCSFSFGVLAGFRYWNFNEELSLKTDSPFIPPFPSDIFLTTDKFQAENNFYGGQIGGKIDYCCSQFFVSLKGKIALGTIQQVAEIKGYLTTNDFTGFGPTETYPGGYFTMPSNIGRHKTHRFAVIPEMNLCLGYQLKEKWLVTVGYTFLCVSSVLWAGNEIDPQINPSQSSVLSNTSTPVLVGEARPKALLKSSSLWVQGFNVGLQWTF